MFVLTVCNHKGGTGKTTSAVHLAAAAALSGRRSLVLDLDPQGFLTHYLGVGEGDDAHTVLRLFDAEARIADLPLQRVGGFDLMPYSPRLTNFLKQLKQPTDVLWAKDALREGGLDEAGYDFVLFDTAAAITAYSLNALVASQHVVIPVTPEYQPVLGAEQTARTVEMVREKLNPDLRPPLYLLTQVDERKRSHGLYRRYLRDTYGGRVLEQNIRTSAALARSYPEGSTVFDHAPSSRGARDYANALDELLGRMQVERQEPPTAAPLPADAPAPNPVR